MKLETEIIIQAPVTIVWNHLMQFENYAAWNPFIKHLRGKPELGKKLNVTIQPPDSSAMKFTPTVLECTTEKSFRWLGHLGFPGIFDGEHYFELIAVDDQQTMFKHGEHFRGILVPLFKNMLKNKTKRGFEEMNKALKQVCENSK